MSPPDARRAAPVRPLAQEVAHQDQLHSDPKAETGQQSLTLGDEGPFHACSVCGGRTLRVLADGTAMHSACEPRHTWATAPATSWSAGRQAQRGRRSILAKRLLELLQNAPAGLTDDELHGSVPEAPGGSIAKRRLDLVRAGLVVDSGLTRPTRHGRDAIVWEVAR